MNGRKNDPRSLVMFVASMLIFGSIGVFRKNLPLSSALIAMTRGLLGGLFIVLFSKLTGRRTGEKIPRTQGLRLAFTGAVMGFNWILLFEAYNHTTVAVATLCYYMQPTIVVLLSPVIFRERLTARSAVCAGIAIIGMILVSGVAGGNDSQSGDVSGILPGLGAAFLYAVVVIMNKRISGIDAYQKTTIQLFSAGIVMIPYLLITGGGSGAGSFDISTVILLLIAGVVHTGIAYVLYFGSMDGLRVQSIAILSYIDPVSALLFSALFLKEQLSITGIAGAILIIGSAIISEMHAKTN